MSIDRSGVDQYEPRIVEFEVTTPTGRKFTSVQVFTSQDVVDEYFRFADDAQAQGYSFSTLSVENESGEPLDNITEVSASVVPPTAVSLSTHECDYEWLRGCGAEVCYDCGDHKGLARCYCGWSASGGNGRQELLDMGENLDEDY